MLKHRRIEVYSIYRYSRGISINIVINRSTLGNLILIKMSASNSKQCQCQGTPDRTRPRRARWDRAHSSLGTTARALARASLQQSFRSLTVLDCANRPGALTGACLGCTMSIGNGCLSVQLIGAAPRRGDGAAIDDLITYFAKYSEFL